MRSWFAGTVLALAASPVAAAEPLVVDPWVERAAPPALAPAAIEPVVEIVDPWAGSSPAELYETDEIVDPWAAPEYRPPTVAFPLIE